MSPRRRIALVLLVSGCVLCTILVWSTRAAMRPLPDTLRPPSPAAMRAQILDRAGRPLSLTYGNAWNVHDEVALHEVPELLRQTFVFAEDRRFFEHHGVDWRARLAAVGQNLRAGRSVRGASTISEQVVRLLHARPRTVWSRWVEGFEAGRLEHRFTKGEILEFYLNQVPYARRRRGVVQAARDYFDRDLSTLRPKEMLALAVLVRSPSRLDLRRSLSAAEGPIGRLARTMVREGVLGRLDGRSVEREPLELREGRLDVRAPHFVQYVRGGGFVSDGAARIRTTLDGSLQRRVEAILAHQISVLEGRGVGDGAVLVADHGADEIRAWVNAGGYSPETQGSQIDAVLAPRQPGSTLKPFLYASALERGWTAATLIPDTPLAEPVGTGLHRYRNYSRRHYGPIRLREALGNSLNIPAVRTIQAVTPLAFYRRLHDLGFESLGLHPASYGEGLALGNGEVTLLELVGAYATLARGGLWRSLRAVSDVAGPGAANRRVYEPEVASIVADILADPDSRRREFGTGGVLELPVRTAVKTGTSNDYRDAWAVGFSERHTVGVWMGNLDRAEMDSVTGAIGPALVLRAVFAELRRDGDSEAVPVSRRLRRAPICSVTGHAASDACPVVHEWFRPENVPQEACSADHVGASGPVSPSASGGSVHEEARWLQPLPGLHLALDPRIPDELEAFALRIETDRVPSRVDWLVDGRPVGTTGSERELAWRPVRGDHVARARVWFEGEGPVEVAEVAFLVK